MYVTGSDWWHCRAYEQLVRCQASDRLLVLRILTNLIMRFSQGDVVTSQILQHQGHPVIARQNCWREERQKGQVWRRENLTYKFLINCWCDFTMVMLYQVKMLQCQGCQEREARRCGERRNRRICTVLTDLLMWFYQSDVTSQDVIMSSSSVYFEAIFVKGREAKRCTGDGKNNRNCTNFW